MRVLVHFVLPFVVGIYVFHLTPSPWQMGAIAAILVFFWFLLGLLQKTWSSILLISVGLIAGYLWGNGYAAVQFSSVQSLIGREIHAEVTLLDYPQEHSYGARCMVRVPDISGKVMYYGDRSLLELAPGDRLSGTMKCYSATEVGGKTSTYYTAKGVFLRVYGAEKMTVIPREAISLRELPQEFKQTLCITVRSIFGKEISGFILALLTGERDELSQQQRADLEESGLMHLTAVSGLHCTFLVSLLRFLLGGNRKLTALAGYPILLFYAVMVGGTPSVVRACIMAGFLLAAPLFQRENDPPTTLAAAAFAILLVNPFAAMSVSFQLSFGAVLGLTLFALPIAETLCDLWHPQPRWMQKIWTAMAKSIGASVSVLVLTAPISAYYFKTISLISPLSNLLVIAVVEVLFAGALVVSLLCMVSSIFAPLAVAVSIPVRYVLCIAGWTAKLPRHAVSFCDKWIIMWLVFVYGILLICWISRDRRRKYAFALGAAVLTLFAVQRMQIELVKDDTLTAISVDVGQGAATLLHSDDCTALIDCGSVYAQRGSGASVADAMRQYGWGKLSCVVLTHYHEDHAGGLDELLARVSVETLLIPWQENTGDALYAQVITLAEQYHIPVRYIDETVQLSLGEASLTIYPPLTDGAENEEGLTVLCSAKEFDLLITGDMGISTERRLIKQYNFPDIEVLFVGHHGSKYATSHELLKAVMPEVGIISVGENSYGHPTMEAMERMAFRGLELYRTDWQGNIVISVH